MKITETEKNNDENHANNPVNNQNKAHPVGDKKTPKPQPEALAWLMQTYPKVFDSKPPKPLKIGIFEDIIALPHKHSSDDIKAALRYYVRSWFYLEKITKENKRYDLEGNAVQDITEKHEKIAASNIAFYRRKKQINSKQVQEK